MKTLINYKIIDSAARIALALLFIGMSLFQPRIAFARNALGAIGEFEYPSFADNRIGAGWYAAPPSGVTASLDATTAYSGTHSQRLDVNSPYSFSCSLGARVRVDAANAPLQSPLREGETATFSMAIKSANIANIKFAAYVTFEKTDSTHPWFYVVSPLTLARNSGWQPFSSRPFSIPSGVKYVDITLFIVSDDAAAGTVWVDGVSLANARPAIAPPHPHAMKTMITAYVGACEYDWAEIAQRFDTIILGGDGINAAPSIRMYSNLYKRNVQVLAYAAGSTRQGAPWPLNWPIDYATALKSGWLLNNTAGTPISWPGDPTLAVANVANPQYQQAWIGGVISKLQGRPIDGVWIDALPEDLYPYYLKPGASAIGCPDNASWHLALASFLSAVYSAFHHSGYGVYANNGADWKLSPWKDMLSRCLDGTYEEGAFYWNSPVGAYVGKNVWNMEIACPSYSPTKNRMAAAMIDLQSDPLHTSKLRFALASYLLGETPASSFGVAPGNSSEWQWSSDLEVNIGLPTAPALNPAPGLYSRAFTKGMVAANGDSIPHSLTLTAPYQDLDGKPYGPGPVTLNPNQGLILLARSLPVFSVITSPQNGALLPLAPLIISGTATDGSGSGIARVDITTDGGKTWKLALISKTAGGGWGWSLAWTPPVAGIYHIFSRATAGNGAVENTAAVTGISVTIAANVLGSLGDFETAAPGGKVGQGWNAPTTPGVTAALDNTTASTGKWSQKLVVNRSNSNAFQDGIDCAVLVGAASAIHAGDTLTFALDARIAPLSASVPVRNLSLFAYLQFRDAKGRPISGKDGGMLVLQPLDAAAISGAWKTYGGVTFTLPATVKDAAGSSIPVGAVDLTLFVGSQPQAPGSTGQGPAGQVWVDNVALWKR